MREFETPATILIELVLWIFRCLTNYLVMIAENVSVGILSLPSAVATLGMVPYVKAFYSTLKFNFSNSSI